MNTSREKLKFVTNWSALLNILIKSLLTNYKSFMWPHLDYGDQIYYIGFPVCVTVKNFTLFPKLDQLEQVLCCSEKDRNVYTN